MAKDGKFGTFGGVFTPSILTILGVIMYLRLPWIVGHAGLIASLGIIIVAHVVSITTGLSVSSIATDKRVGAGGPYYIVSRSLGLPIGGTLGIALFLGLSISIAFYIIGFCESFLPTIGVEPTENAIRVAGTATVVGLTIITFISTAFAIKTQYLILGLIGLSLVAIFLGSPEPPAQSQMAPAEDAPSMGMLFGIFFPAVTGFTAGVNMSGDLRDSKKAIPRGTIAAILTGLIVYVALAVYFSMRIDREQLVDNPEVLLDTSWFPPFVIAGIWGATLSSALGCILGAPRVLQAMSGDGITPRLFFKGTGKTNEPRRALLVAFLIGEAGILLASLNAIAGLVSMVFLALYGFLNLSCWIESWASPDFRPAFRVPRFVNLIGGIAAVLLMVQIDLAATFGAVTLMAALYVYLQRKQLQLESGDTWRGFWEKLVRTGLSRLRRTAGAQRNWRPNVLLFRVGHEPKEMVELARALSARTGMVTDCELVDEGRVLAEALAEPKTKDADAGPGSPQLAADADDDEERVGMFHRRIDCTRPLETAAALCRFHGFSGLEPNTVMLDWRSRENDPDGFSRVVNAVTEHDLNLLVYARSSRPTRTGDKKRARRIDVWWRTGVGNVPLSVALLRFVTSELAWRGTNVRFLLWSEESANNDNLRTTMRRVLVDARMDADVRVVNDTRGFDARVIEESDDAELVLLGLPDDAGAMDERFFADTESLLGSLGQVMLLRASTFFPEELTVAQRAKISSLPPMLDGAERPELPEVPTPEPEALAGVVTSFAEETLTAAVKFHDHCVASVYGEHARLIRRVEQIARSELGPLLSTDGEHDTESVRRLVDEAQRAVGKGVDAALTEHLEQKLAMQRSTLEGRVETLFAEAKAKLDRRAERLRVTRPAADFAASPDDPPHVRSIKRRRRIAAKFRGGNAVYNVPRGALDAYWYQQLLLELVRPHVSQLTLDARQLAVQLGKVLGAFRTRLALLLAEGRPDAPLAEGVAAELDRLGERLDALSTVQKQRLRELQWASLVAARRVAREHATDIDRPDVDRLVLRDRRLPKDVSGDAALVASTVGSWVEEQALLLERARLAIALSSFQHRLASSTHALKTSVASQLESGTLRSLVSLRDGLEALRGRPDDQELRAKLTGFVELEASFDARQAVDALLSEMATVTQALPEAQEILSDTSLAALEEKGGAEIEIVEMPIRRLAQFLVESELVGGLQEAFAEAPRVEQKAVSVARDIARLLSMQEGETDDLDEDEAPIARQVSAAAANAIGRLDGQIAEVQRLVERLDAAINEHLRSVVDATNPYDLSNAWAKVSQQARVLSGKKAVSGAQSALLRVSEEIRTAFVQLLYRRSAGIVLAKRLEKAGDNGGSAVDRVLAMVDAASPTPHVVTSLPSYYRQLFLGQSTINETFWVGRGRELRQARDAIEFHRRGTPGAILVVGERGIGKSALCQRIATRLTDGVQVYWVQPPPGGSADPADLRAALGRAVGAEGSAARVIRTTPPGSVFVLDDLELWWERREGGEAAIDAIFDLVSRHGDKRLFVLGMGRHAHALLSKLRPIGDQALATIACDPMPAEELEAIITLRHGSSGLEFRLGGRDEDRMTPWRKARLFSGHFDYSGGNVGAALRAWLAHVADVEERTLVVRIPDKPRWGALDDLRPEHAALLIQLVLHKQAAFERLARVTGLPHAELREELEPLRRMGLVVRSRQRTLAVNPFVQHAVLDRFERRGLLS